MAAEVNAANIVAEGLASIVMAGLANIVQDYTDTSAHCIHSRK